MKISYNWLKQYINIDTDPVELEKILTAIGLEVEGIETFESIKGGLKGLITGEVLTCSKHPNADKLSVTTVNVGQGEPLPIVCGAPNVAAGQKVIVATVGTTLYSGDDSFEIKKAKIRGEVSQGMICAEDEIGIGDSHAGIMVLDATTKPGTPASEIFNVETDTVFEIGLTPNRVDSSSHIGVARDLVAYFKQQQNIELEKPSVDKFNTEDTSLPISVTIENPESCNRYTGVSISGVTIKPSPEWLQNRLKAIGLNPINNIVDITNFVLHETGQPLHAFDAEEIAGKSIIAKKLVEGTKFTTLDEEEHTLSSEDLMICDGDKPVAMGGVFGGLNSGVTEKTTNIFLESAYFDPVSVRKTAKRHGISTDSSFRFERGVDPDGTLYALKRAALLMKELGGGQISSEIIDIHPVKTENFIVDISYKNIARLIGKELGQDTIKNILIALEMKILEETSAELKVEVPAYRVDVQREADIVEDILRIYGYNNIEFSEELHTSLTYSKKPEKTKLTVKISDFLASKGFNEIMSNSLSKASYYESLETLNNEKTVKIFNPLSSDLNAMRQTLLFGGLEAIKYNLNRQQQNIRLFEFGNCYQKIKNEADKQINKYKEKEYLGLFLAGIKNPLQWNNSEEQYTFYTLKSYAEELLKKLNVFFKIKIEDVEAELFDYALGYSANNKSILVIGKVNSDILSQFDIDEDVFYADFEWSTIFSMLKNEQVKFVSLPKFPEVKRDFALLIDENVTFAQIKELAYKTDKKLIKDVQLFDLYKGDKIEKGKKSYGIGFTLQDESKTLTDKQIDKVMNNLKRIFEIELGATLR